MRKSPVHDFLESASLPWEFGFLTILLDQIWILRYCKHFNQFHEVTMPDKEFGKYTRPQLREIFARYLEMRSLESEFNQTIHDNPRKIEKLTGRFEPWGPAYEIPHLHVALVIAELLGIRCMFEGLENYDNPQQEFLDRFNAYDEESKDIDASDELDVDEERLLFTLLFANQGNIHAMQQYSVPMSELLSRAASGDDESLFRAVSVDRNTLYSNPAINRIAKATLLQDEAFMQQLSKAITGTRPRRPAEKFDDLRYFLELLDEIKGLESMTRTEIYDLLVEDFELHPDSDKTPIDSLNKLIQKRNKNTRN